MGAGGAQSKVQARNLGDTSSDGLPRDGLSRQTQFRARPLVVGLFRGFINLCTGGGGVHMPGRLPKGRHGGLAGVAAALDGGWPVWSEILRLCSVVCGRTSFLNEP